MIGMKFSQSHLGNRVTVWDLTNPEPFQIGMRDSNRLTHEGIVDSILDILKRKRWKLLDDGEIKPEA